jgi:hypothetical protein
VGADIELIAEEDWLGANGIAGRRIDDDDLGARRRWRRQGQDERAQKRNEQQPIGLKPGHQRLSHGGLLGDSIWRQG